MRVRRSVILAASTRSKWTRESPELLEGAQMLNGLLAASD